MQIFLLVLAFAAATALISYISICAVIAHIMTRAKRVSPYRNTAWENHQPDQITFSPRPSARRETIQLAAWFISVANPQGAIILVHGKDCCRGGELNTNTYDLARSFRANGFSTLLLDLRGHGQSDSARMTYGLHECDDVLGAIDWLVDKGYAVGNIGLFGASMGGACAIAAAAQMPNIGALVTDSTYSDFQDMMTRKFRKLSGMPREFLPGTLAIVRLMLKADFRDIRPARNAKYLTERPMLVIHSDADQFVPVDHAQALATAGNAQLWIARGDHHMASYRSHPEEYRRRVTQFFCQHVGVVQLRAVA
jgi:uncharacterized protein